MTISKAHSQRWTWFLDVVFGAIVALGIQEYEPTLRKAMSQETESLVLSVYVAFAIFSFVVYDISVYHTLVKKFPYRLTALGFVRFYVDLVMAFALYVLMVSAFKEQPCWYDIVTAITVWHIAAFAWHVLARREYGVVKDFFSSAMPHIWFIAIYWLYAGIVYSFGKVIRLEDPALSSFILIIVSTTIFVVSLFRWNQVLEKDAAENYQQLNKSSEKTMFKSIEIRKLHTRRVSTPSTEWDFPSEHRRL